MKNIIDKLYKENNLSRNELALLINDSSKEDLDYLFSLSRKTSQANFGNMIYTRGLIEFSNYCKNDCFYCGIRKSNKCAERYRLTKEDILNCCQSGYDLGFRTFVLQSGEDGYFNDDMLIDIISTIKNKYSDCAITLSIGEKSKESYKKYFDAGADRYLLRHETITNEHYIKLHPNSMELNHRIQCLKDLKEIGYQVGCGIMVGSPFQTTENLINDLIFIKEFNPEMVGIGPFIAQHNTPFKDYPNGSVDTTLLLLGIIRLLLPKVLLPATTALGTLDPQGREKGILSGANVVMPNLSPVSVRKKYALYDNKICTGDEAAECRNCLDIRMKSIGYNLVVDRGDYKNNCILLEE